MGDAIAILRKEINETNDSYFVAPIENEVVDSEEKIKQLLRDLFERYETVLDIVAEQDMAVFNVVPPVYRNPSPFLVKNSE